MRKYYIAFLLIVFIGTKSYSQNFDINLLQSINPTNPSAGYWQKTSSTAYAISVGIPASEFFIGWINKDKHLQNRAWETMGGLAINTVLAEALKYTVNRQRPYTQYPTLINPYNNSEIDKSFPSGHTSAAFSVATSLAIQYKKWYIVAPAYLWAGSVGYGRLYLGEHYPTDVIAGAAIGAGSAWLSHWINKKYFTRKLH